MSRFSIIFKNGECYEDFEAEFYEWPKSPQSKMLYFYDVHRKPIGMFNIDTISIVRNISISSDDTSDCVCCKIFLSNKEYTIIYTDESNYIPELNIVHFKYRGKTKVTANLNVVYGYSKEIEHEKQVQAGRESNDN